MRWTRQAVMAAVVVLCTVASVVAADEKAEALRVKMLDAYKNTRTLDARVTLTLSQTQGRWVSQRSTEIPIGFDRDTQQLKVDKPEFIVVADGKKIRIKSEEIPGTFAELDQPAGLKHDDLINAVRFLANPPVPDLALLTSEDPLAVLNNGSKPDLTYLEPDAQDSRKRPGLRFQSQAGVTTLRIEPDSGLVTGVVIEMNVAAMGGKDGDGASIIYSTAINKHNQPLDAAVFAFETKDLKSFPTLQDWIADAQQQKQGAAQGGQGGQGGQEGEVLEGKPAPAVELPTLDGKAFKLSEEKARVVVLDFWATWCPPCRRGLPVIQKISEWAAAEKLSVAVYTVNLQEDVDEVKKFMTENKLTLPVLMDAKGEVGMAYGCETIPRTAIIVDGKVLKIHSGFSPDMEEEIKKEISAALAPAK